MAKISLEIDGTSEEITDIVSGVIANLNKSVNPEQPTHRGVIAQLKPIKKRPRRVPKRSGMGQRRRAALKSGEVERLVPVGMPQNSFRYWTDEEIEWLTKYVRTKPIGNKTVKSFERKFGYLRSISSIDNKAGTIRKSL